MRNPWKIVWNEASCISMIHTSVMNDNDEYDKVIDNDNHDSHEVDMRVNIKKWSLSLSNKLIPMLPNLSPSSETEES